jgi:hypothetical protein
MGERVYDREPGKLLNKAPETYQKKLKIVSVQYGFAFNFHCFEPCQCLLFLFFFGVCSLNVPHVQIDPFFLDFHHTAYFRLQYFHGDVGDRWVAVTTAWRILSLRIWEWPPKTKGSCEYIE